MRKITIVGAGQAGLMVGVGLVRKGYAVTIVSDRTPEEIRNGRVTSSQGMQATPIAYEREMGLRLWDDIYAPWDGIEFNVLNPEDGSMVFTGDNSSLRLDIDSITHILLSLDSDGDQVFETVTTLLWSDLDTPIAADIGDDDGDEMHNSWEVFYGLDPANSADAVLDNDSDGRTNHQEYLDRTDPTAVDS